MGHLILIELRSGYARANQTTQLGLRDSRSSRQSPPKSWIGPFFGLGAREQRRPFNGEMLDEHKKPSLEKLVRASVRQHIRAAN